MSEYKLISITIRKLCSALVKNKNLLEQVKIASHGDEALLREAYEATKMLSELEKEHADDYFRTSRPTSSRRRP